MRGCGGHACLCHCVFFGEKKEERLESPGSNLTGFVLFLFVWCEFLSGEFIVTVGLKQLE